MASRYFEFIGADAQRSAASSSKFWEVTVSGNNVTVCFGKIGTAGQTQVKDFSTRHNFALE